MSSKILVNLLSSFPFHRIANPLDANHSLEGVIASPMLERWIAVTVDGNIQRVFVLLCSRFFYLNFAK